MKEQDTAIQELETAVALNPNFFDFPYAAVFVYARQPVADTRYSARLTCGSIHSTRHNSTPFRVTHFTLLRRYREALAPLRECIRRGPKVLLGQLWLAATLVRLGQIEEAKAIAAGTLNDVPHLRLKKWPALSVYRDPGDAEHVAEALRMAGFP